jgi:hypothetical protein
MAASNRGDLKVMLLNYEPGAEVWFRGFVEVGVDDLYHGHEIRAVNLEMDQAFADWSLSIREIADGGDRIAIRTDFVANGRSSGVRVDLKDAGTAIKFSARGLIVWQEWFAEQGGWSKALEAVGLSEQHAQADS